MSWCWWRGARRNSTTLAGRDRGARQPRPPCHRGRSHARRCAGARSPTSFARAGLEPHFVVNNAGFGLLGAAAELDRAEQLAMIDLNVRVLTDLSLRFIDSLDAPPRRHSQRRVGRELHARARAWRSITPPRPTCCRSARRCITSSSRGACASRRCVPGPVETEFQARAGMPDGAISRACSTARPSASRARATTD